MSPFGLRWLRVFFIQALFMLCLTITASAQSVDSVLFTLDTTPIICQFVQTFTTDTVRGYIQNLGSDSVYFGFEPGYGPQWVIRTEISGKHFPALERLTDTIGPHKTLPVLILVNPYAERPDTESACFSLMTLPDSAVQEHCIPLYLQTVNNDRITGDSVLFILDTTPTPIHYQIGQPAPKPDTVRGYIQNFGADSAFFGLTQPYPSQWYIYTLISGNDIIPWPLGSMGIGPHETLPIQIRVTFTSLQSIDTENACITLINSGAPQEHCIPLYLEAASGVSRDEASSNSLAIYPNPASSTIQIIYQYPIYSFYLLDLLGRHVLSERIAGNAMLDVSKLAPGQYEAVVYTSNGIVTAPVIIQR